MPLLHSILKVNWIASLHGQLPQAPKMASIIPLSGLVCVSANFSPFAMQTGQILLLTLTLQTDSAHSHHELHIRHQCWCQKSFMFPPFAVLSRSQDQSKIFSKISSMTVPDSSGSGIGRDPHRPLRSSKHSIVACFSELEYQSSQPPKLPDERLHTWSYAPTLTTSARQVGCE